MRALMLLGLLRRKQPDLSACSMHLPQGDDKTLAVSYVTLPTAVKPGTGCWVNRGDPT